MPLSTVEDCRGFFFQASSKPSGNFQFPSSGTPLTDHSRFQSHQHSKECCFVRLLGRAPPQKRSAARPVSFARAFPRLEDLSGANALQCSSTAASLGATFVRRGRCFRSGRSPGWTPGQLVVTGSCWNRAPSWPRIGTGTTPVPVVLTSTLYSAVATAMDKSCWNLHVLKHVHSRANSFNIGPCRTAVLFYALSM